MKMNKFLSVPTPKKLTFIQRLEKLGFKITRDDKDSFQADGPDEYDNDTGKHILYENETIELNYQSQRFEFCCGAREIGEFEYVGPKEFEADTYEHLFSNLMKEPPVTGMLIASYLTNNVVSTVLRNLGWQEQTFVNPNTRNKLSLFTWAVPAKRRSK